MTSSPSASRRGWRANEGRDGLNGPECFAPWDEGCHPCASLVAACSTPATQHPSSAPRSTGIPCPLACPANSEILEDRQQERSEQRSELLAGSGGDCKTRAPRERADLGRPRRIIPISSGQANRSFRGNRRVTLGKSSADGLDQGQPVECESARQVMQVEEILDTTVAVAENHERFQLFGDHGLARVGKNFRRRKVEQRRRTAA